MPTIKVTDENFDQVVLKSEKPFLQRFTAEWCGQSPLIYLEGTIFLFGPCKMIAPLLEELSVELSDKLTFGVQNIDEEPNVPTRFGVRGIPTLLLFKGGKVLDTKVGASSKQQIKDWILSKIQLRFRTSPIKYSDPVMMMIAFGSSFAIS